MNLDELRQRRDVWPIVASRIPDAILHIHQHLDDVLDHPDLMSHLERKFRKGEAEHNGAWLRDSDPSWLIGEAAEEILDFILYQAMYVVHYHARTEEDS
jgi:hypothetical protein